MAGAVWYRTRTGRYTRPRCGVVVVEVVVVVLLLSCVCVLGWGGGVVHDPDGEVRETQGCIVCVRFARLRGVLCVCVCARACKH